MSPAIAVRGCVERAGVLAQPPSQRGEEVGVEVRAHQLRILIMEPLPPFVGVTEGRTVSDLRDRRPSVVGSVNDYSSVDVCAPLFIQTVFKSNRIRGWKWIDGGGGGWMFAGESAHLFRPTGPRTRQTDRFV